MGFKINRIKADLGSYPHYMLLGIRKIGKTTFIRDLIKEKYGDATKGLLISCGAENGYHALDDLQVEEAKVFNQDYDEETDSRGFIQIIDDIVENNKDYGIKLVAIDTLDCLYDIAAQEAIRLSRKETGKPCKSINDAFGGFGRGLDRVIALIQEQITRLEDAGIPVHELGSTSEANDAFMLLRTIGAPDGDVKSAGASGIVILPGTDRGVEHLYQMLQRVLPTEYARFTDYASVRDALTRHTPESLVEKSETPLVISLSTATPLSTQLRFVQAGGVALVPVTAATSLQQVRELFAQLDQLEGVNALAVFLDRE